MWFRRLNLGLYLLGLLLPLWVFAEPKTKEEFLKQQTQTTGPVVKDLQRIVNALRLPSDPPVNIVYVDSDIPVAEISRAQPHVITISKHYLDQAQTEDDIAAILAHEIGHTEETTNKYRDSQRTEMRVADEGGLRRLVHAGYSPIAMRSFILNGTQDKTNALFAAASTHPEDQLRITNINLWLSKNESSHVYADSRKLSSTLQATRLTKAPQWVAPALVAQKREVQKPYTKFEPKIIKEDEFFRALETDSDYLALSEFRKIKVQIMARADDRVRYLLGTKYFHPIDRERSTAKDYLHQTFNSDKISHTTYDKLHHIYADLNIVEVSFDHHKSLEAYVQKIANSKDPVAQNTVKEILRLIPSDYKFSYSIGNELKAKLLSMIVDRSHIRTLDDYFVALEDGKHGKIEPLTEAERITFTKKFFDEAKNDNDLLRSLHELTELGRNETRWAGVPNFLDREKDIYQAAKRAGDYKVLTQFGMPSSPYQDTTYLDQNYTSMRREWPIRLQLDPDVSPLYKLAVFSHERNTEDPNYPKLVSSVFRDITTPEQYFALIKELQSAHDRVVNPGVIAFGLQQKKDWKLSEKLLNDFADYEKAWSKTEGIWGVMNFAKPDDQAGINYPLKRHLESIGFPDATQAATKQPNQYFKDSPAYAYDSRSSEALQRELIRLLDPPFNSLSPQKKHEIIVKLASRGATGFTDNLIDELYLKNRANIDPDHVKEILEKNLVWDFEIRRKLFEPRIQEITKNILSLSEPHQRLAAILGSLQTISDYFPEDSPSRQALIESVAKNVLVTQSEAKAIHLSSGEISQKAESYLVRAVSGISQSIQSLSPEERWQFIKFLQGHGEPPVSLADKINSGLGKDRLLRIFKNLDPNVKAAIIDPILTLPHGLMKDPAWRERIVDDIVSTLPEAQRKQTRMLINASQYALEKAAPYQQSFAISYILGQIDADSNLHPAERLKMFLSAYGATGVSLGQKLYQRRMVPDDWLPHLASLTDSAQSPSMHDIYELMSKKLGVANLDEVLKVEAILGDASTKVVVKVRYKDGHTREFDDYALKLLWDNLDRKIDIEEGKLTHVLDYLETHGGPEYGRLRSVINSVHRNLRTQADISTEARMYDDIKKLYEGHQSGFDFKIARPDTAAGIGPGHVHEQVAPGVGIKDLSESERKAVYAAISEKEANVLLADGDPKTKLVSFEGDRHTGNYRIDLSTKPPTIWIIDYPLLTSIPQTQRDAALELMALIEGTRTNLNGTPYGSMKTHMEQLLSKLTTDANSNIKVNAEMLKFIKDYSRNPTRGLVPTFLDVLGAARKNHIEIAPAVDDYITALGHAEHYGEAKFVDLVAQKAETLAKQNLASFQPSFGDKCRIMLTKIANTIKLGK